MGWWGEGGETGRARPWSGPGGPSGVDGETLLPGVRGEPRLPGSERAGGVGAVGQGLADGLGPVGRRLVEERRPLEGEPTVELMSAKTWFTFWPP